MLSDVAGFTGNGSNGQDSGTYYIFLGYVDQRTKKQKKKLTDTGLFGFTWIIGLNGFFQIRYWIKIDT